MCRDVRGTVNMGDEVHGYSGAVSHIAITYRISPPRLARRRIGNRR